MDTYSDGKQTATIWFAPTNKDSADIAVAQANGDPDEVVNIYGRAANRASPIVDFDEILEGQGASVTQHDMGDAYDQAYLRRKDGNRLNQRHHTSATPGDS
jgi:hypothetical protein